MMTKVLHLLLLACICDAYSSWNAIRQSSFHHRSNNIVLLRKNGRRRAPLHMSDTTTTTDSSTSTDIIDRTTTTPPSAKTIPLWPNTFAGQVEEALLAKYPASKIERILQSWRLAELDYEHKEFVGSQQSPPLPEDVDGTSRCYQHAPSYVPGLRAVAWWDDDLVTNLPWAKSLAKSYKAIREEFTEVMSNPTKLASDGNNIWAGALTTDAESYGEGWKTLVLLNRGQWDETNAGLFPVTSKAIHKSGVPAAEAFFASMKPQSSIAPHSDFTNFVLTSHLPLVVPENGKNKCRLSVGDETREWLEGKVILFDTSIYHDAINDSEEMRYILMLRVWHPDLTEEERGALQLIYDILEIPELLDKDPKVADRAEDMAKKMREFPLKDGAIGGGFGGGAGGGKGKKGKGKNKKKGRK